MDTCMSCPSNKGLMKQIINHIKVMSLKAVRVQRPRKAESAGAAAAIDEASEGIGGQGEWLAEPDHGVLLTLVALPNGGNYVKRMRFSMEVFDDWGAQQWWSENYEKIMELYSVASSQVPSTPVPSDDEQTCSVQVQEEEESSNGALCSPRSFGSSSKAQKKPQQASDEAELNELDWVVGDEPEVFVTVDECLMAPRRYRLNSAEKALVRQGCGGKRSREQGQAP